MVGNFPKLHVIQLKYLLIKASFARNLNSNLYMEAVTKSAHPFYITGKVEVEECQQTVICF